jgi:dinuclear metal center YbgI/SA1388 family protein
MIISLELLTTIEESAPPVYAAPWDSSGMQVAGTRDEIRRLAVFLDPLPGNVDEALDWGADFLLCHHPLLLKPRLPNRVDAYHRVLRSILTSGSWLYAAHTSLDANPSGPVLWLAKALHLLNTRTLEPCAAVSGAGEPGRSAAGYGVIGAFERPLEWSVFAGRLSKALGTREWTAAGPLPERVGTIAYCPGSGGSMIGRANAADLFVTGDLKYHQALESIESGLCTLDVGHFVLEERMMEFWAGELRDALGGRAEVRFFPGAEPMRIIAIA